jgi:hypothetical protein
MRTAIAHRGPASFRIKLVHSRLIARAYVSFKFIFSTPCVFEYISRKTLVVSVNPSWPNTSSPLPTGDAFGACGKARLRPVVPCCFEDCAMADVIGWLQGRKRWMQSIEARSTLERVPAAIEMFVEFFYRKDGAGDRIRTGDINLGKVALYQLSYSRLPSFLILASSPAGCQFKQSSCLNHNPVTLFFHLPGPL